MNVPEYLQPFCKIIREKKSENYYVLGSLYCCENSSFEVSYSGDLHRNIFGHKYFLAGEKRTILIAKCSKCSREIHIFDDAIDGYNNCIDTGNRQKDSANVYPLWCNKCHHNKYQIMVSYEYPNFKELENLNIRDKENSFTWITISLRCAECYKSYKKIIDFEMG